MGALLHCVLVELPPRKDDELVDSGKMTEKGFHDAVLQEGNIPVPLLRAGMLGLIDSPDYRPNWRFYGG